MEAVRVDKWLWAARFFKTRGLAKTAIENGKIRCDGQRIKPSRNLRGGELLNIRKDEQVFEIQVVALSDRRGPASQAVLLYQETEQSLLKREQTRQMRRDEWVSRPVPERRPDKKQRRQLNRIKQDQS